MKIEGTHVLKARRDRIWSLLTDPVVLARCIPGCEKLEATGDDVYETVLRVGIASIKGVYSGKVKMEDKQPPAHYKLMVEGKGAQGFVKGVGTIDLEEREGETLVSYKGDVQVGGTIASVGQRMLQGAARMMVAQFFTAMEAEAVALPTEPPPKHNFFRIALRVISGLLKRLFVRKRGPAQTGN